MGMMKKSSDSYELNPHDESKHIPDMNKKVPFAEKLTRNVLVAALLLCCVVGARDLSLAPDQTVLDVLQNAVESEWDDNLGRLVYVNSTLSDAIAVFSSSRQTSLYQPSNGEVIDVFSPSAPYIVYHNAGTVYAAADGEVLSVTPDNNGQSYTIRIFSNQAFECLYYGLQSCNVHEGDVIEALSVIGECGDQALYFEVRQNGAALDASPFFIPRQAQ